MPKTGNSEFNDFLNESQSAKRSTTSEKVDSKGLVSRQRVVNQTIFDQMMIKFLIEQPQHEAVHIFMESISKAGGSIPSVDLERVETGPVHKAGDNMADKRMIFSAAYRAMSHLNSEDACKAVMHLCSRPYDIPSNMESIQVIAEMISPPLWSLAKHYGIHLRRDPRRIINSIMYRGRR